MVPNRLRVGNEPKMARIERVSIECQMIKRRSTGQHPSNPAKTKLISSDYAAVYRGGGGGEVGGGATGFP